MKKETSWSKIFTQFVMAIATTTYKGYALSVMWAWFIASTFGLPLISVPVAVGVMYSVILFKHMPSKLEQDNMQEYSARLAFDILVPSIVLLFGWIVKGFM